MNKAEQQFIDEYGTLEFGVRNRIHKVGVVVDLENVWVEGAVNKDIYVLAIPPPSGSIDSSYVFAGYCHGQTIYRKTAKYYHDKLCKCISKFELHTMEQLRGLNAQLRGVKPTEQPQGTPEANGDGDGAGQPSGDASLSDACEGSDGSGTVIVPDDDNGETAVPGETDDVSSPTGVVSGSPDMDVVK